MLFKVFSAEMLSGQDNSYRLSNTKQSDKRKGA